MPLQAKPYSCFDIPNLRYGDSHSLWKVFKVSEITQEEATIESKRH